jgi:hypothetical protein
MKLLFEPIAVAFVAAGLMAFTSQASAATINFDDLSVGDLVDDAYVGLGVTFVDARVTDVHSARTGVSAPNTIDHATNGTIVDPSDPIKAIFTSAVMSVSIAGFDIGSGGLILSAYDAVSGGNQVDSMSFVSGPSDGAVLTVTGSNIFRVEFSKETAAAGDGVSFDNFVFEPANAVPLPATLPLFVSGLGALGLLGWRRRKRITKAAV